MAESEGFQEVVNKAAMQAVTVLMVALRGMDVGQYLAPIANLREPQQQRHGWLALEKPSISWNVQDRFIKLLNFEIKVMISLERHMSLLMRKKLLLEFENSLDWGGLQLTKMFTNEKKNAKWQSFFTVLRNKFRPCHNRIVLSLQLRKLHK